MDKNNIQAFPHFKVDEDRRQYVDSNMTGMSLRDYFAAKAMQGLISKMEEKFIRDQKYYEHFGLVENAYLIADAMLTQRQKAMKTYTQEELDLKLKEQHRNDRRDSVDIVNQHFAKYASIYSLNPEVREMMNSIVSDILNMNQRKP